MINIDKIMRLLNEILRTYDVHEEQVKAGGIVAVHWAAQQECEGRRVVAVDVDGNIVSEFKTGLRKHTGAHTFNPVCMDINFGGGNADGC